MTDKLTEKRKRQRDEEDLQMPQAKRLSSGFQTTDSNREAWESESSSSESSWISSGSISSALEVSGYLCAPGLGTCTPLSASEQTGYYVDLPSYQHINRLLKEAHFHSLHSRTQTKPLS